MSRVASAPDAAVAAVVYSAGRSDVRHVIVDGRVVVEDGECRTLDVDTVRRKADEAWARIGARL